MFRSGRILRSLLSVSCDSLASGWSVYCMRVVVRGALPLAAGCGG